MFADLTVKRFLDETASKAPVPGGGSISALNGAIGSALAQMVTGLTIGRKKYVEVDAEMQEYSKKMEEIRALLIEDIDRDSAAYDGVMNAYKLPKETEEEKALRASKIQEETKKAAQVPMDVAERILSMVPMIKEIAKKGNQNAVTDATIAMMTARNGVIGALLNVRINLGSIEDVEFVDRMKKLSAEMEAKIQKEETELLEWVNTVL